MSHLIVCGINYNSAPIAIRERFVIPDSCIKHALTALAGYPHILESVMLSTCNRTEVYALVSDVHKGLSDLAEFFRSAQSNAGHELLTPKFKLLEEDVALHLMRVAAGLDSMVLGEAQIMGQIRDAYLAALEAGTAGAVLSRLFQQALECGKRARAETAIGRLAVSVSSVAVALAKDMLGCDSSIETTIIGAGRMARECLKHFPSLKSAAPIHILNRSPEKIENFAANFQRASSERTRHYQAFESRHEIAARSKLVIVATSAPTYLLEFEEFVLARRKCPQASDFRPLIVDISVPRNVDPKIGDIDGVTLKHADDLSCILERNMKQRESLVGDVEAIVFAELDKFVDWQRSRAVTPTIVALRSKIETIRQDQLSKCARRSKLDEQDLEELSRAIVNQFLHCPTVRLKTIQNSRQEGVPLDVAIQELFGLDIIGSQSNQ